MEAQKITVIAGICAGLSGPTLQLRHYSRLIRVNQNLAGSID
jgi:hypothetical protein